MKSDNLTDNKQHKSIRKPVQKRSIRTKEKILNTAYELFCEKGYYKTTTNEIAQKAGVSIGSLYSYFKDKDVIFFEILGIYHQKFLGLNLELKDNDELLKNDVKKWLRIIIEKQIEIHEESKEFNRELNVLSFYNPKIEALLIQNKKETMNSTIGSFVDIKDFFGIVDIEAFITIVYDLISSTVDRIVFGKNEIDKERLINTTIDMIYRYLLSNK